MPDQVQMIVCRRCGRGFILTDTYRDMRARRRAEVVVPMLCPTCFLKKGPLPKQRGKVKWFDPRKHYGFIVTDEDKEIFFHRKQVLGDEVDEACEGRTARFHVRRAKKGPEALNVELIER